MQCKLCTEIHDLIAVNSCQIGPAKKVIILLSDTVVILYKAGSRTDVVDRHIKLILSTCTYSFDDFNTKIKAAVLKQNQDWEVPQIKDLNMVSPDHYTFTTPNNLFIVLGITKSFLLSTIYLKLMLNI